MTANSATPTATTPAGKYMTFKLAQEAYGLEILKVREIIRQIEITRVPKASDYMRGVINLRGKIIPVVDLRLKLGMERTQPTDQTVIIVVQFFAAGADVTIGVLVDEVLEVLSIGAEAIEPTPTFGSIAVDTQLILGIGNTDKRVVFLLDIAKVLSTNDATPCAQAGSTSPPSKTTAAASARVG